MIGSSSSLEIYMESKLTNNVIMHVQQNILISNESVSLKTVFCIIKINRHIIHYINKVIMFTIRNFSVC